MNASLHRFWVKFKNPPSFSPLNMGCGVTAYSRDDVLAQVRASSLMPVAGLEIDGVVENVAIDSLDARHVRPNMGDASQRGVWFPLGF